MILIRKSELKNITEKLSKYSFFDVSQFNVYIEYIEYKRMKETVQAEANSFELQIPHSNIGFKDQREMHYMVTPSNLNAQNILFSNSKILY